MLFVPISNVWSVVNVELQILFIIVYPKLQTFYFKSTFGNIWEITIIIIIIGTTRMMTTQHFLASLNRLH